MFHSNLLIEEHGFFKEKKFSCLQNVINEQKFNFSLMKHSVVRALELFYNMNYSVGFHVYQGKYKDNFEMNYSKTLIYRTLENWNFLWVSCVGQDFFPEDNLLIWFWKLLLLFWKRFWNNVFLPIEFVFKIFFFKVLWTLIFEMSKFVLRNLFYILNLKRFLFYF